MSSHLVKDLLQHKATIVFTTAPDATVQEPLELMVSKSISSLPVISQGELVGLFPSATTFVRLFPSALCRGNQGSRHHER